MNISSVNTGVSPNDGTGSTIRDAFNIVNTNFNSVETFITSYNYQSPSTGFNLTIGNDISSLILNPSATIASGNITMPGSPWDGFVQRICTTNTITSLTMIPNLGQTIKNGLTTITAGQGVGYIFRSTDNTWYRLY
jgi:hypothetical protein